VKQQTVNEISRRQPTEEEKRSYEERTAEVNADIAKALAEAPAVSTEATDSGENSNKQTATSYNPMEVDSDSSEDELPTEGTTMSAEAVNTTITAEG
jgi:hypothetical protein